MVLAHPLLADIFVAETIGCLDQKVFGNCAWGEGGIAVIFIACVFKKLSEANPNGRPQVGGWGGTVAC